MSINRIKKMLCFVISFLSLNALLVVSPPLRAQETTTSPLTGSSFFEVCTMADLSVCLNMIVANTFLIIGQLDTGTSDTIGRLTNMYTKLMTIPDISPSAKYYLDAFGKTGTYEANRYYPYTGATGDLVLNQFNSVDNKITMENLITRDPQQYITKKLPFTQFNQLSYYTLFGLPLVGEEKFYENLKTYKINYISSLSGLNIKHVEPRSDFPGTESAKAPYQNYYNTVQAIESFNSSVLSNIYLNEDYIENLKKQKEIAATISGEEWIKNIASEPIGWVLRQILLFESQNYLMLAKLNDLQQKALSAQIMTNTLLIANGTQNESYLLNLALGRIQLPQ